MVDVAAVLEKLASLNLIRLNKPSGNWYSIYCPFHSGGNERRPSCGVLLKDEHRNGRTMKQGTFHCFTCGRLASLEEGIGDILQSHQISGSGLDWLKANIPGFDPSTVEFDYLIDPDLMGQVNDTFAVEYMKMRKNLAFPQYVSEEELQSYRFTVPYMYQRGLTDELIEMFDVGFDRNFQPPGWHAPIPSITFPVRDITGNTLFICRRAIDRKLFYIPSDVEKPLYGIYELPKGCKSVVIAESCFNVHTCYKYGFPAVGLLGTGNVGQFQQLKSLGVREFVIGTDPDEAGDRSARRIKQQLRDVAIIRRMKDIPTGKDLNDLSYQEFCSIYENRE